MCLNEVTLFHQTKSKALVNIEFLRKWFSTSSRMLSFKRINSGMPESMGTCKKLPARLVLFRKQECNIVESQGAGYPWAIRYARWCPEGPESNCPLNQLSSPRLLVLEEDWAFLHWLVRYLIADFYAQVGGHYLTVGGKAPSSCTTMDRQCATHMFLIHLPWFAVLPRIVSLLLPFPKWKWGARSDIEM